MRFSQAPAHLGILRLLTLLSFPQVEDFTEPYLTARAVWVLALGTRLRNGGPTPLRPRREDATSGENLPRVLSGETARYVRICAILQFILGMFERENSKTSEPPRAHVEPLTPRARPEKA
jgi:hypothetical protein